MLAGSGTVLPGEAGGGEHMQWSALPHKLLLLAAAHKDAARKRHGVAAAQSWEGSKQVALAWTLSRSSAFPSTQQAGPTQPFVHT